MEKTDTQLLALLKKGDEAAFTAIYRRYSERLYRNLLTMLKSPEVSEELLQEIFMKIWLKRSEINIQVGLYPYIYQIGKNLVYDFFKKAARDKALLQQLAICTWEGSSDDQAIFSEKESLLYQVLEQLPIQRRRVFYLCKVEGKSYQEVSNMLHISVSTVSDHIVKAGKAIQTFVKSHSGEMAISLIVCDLLKGL